MSTSLLLGGHSTSGASVTVMVGGVVSTTRTLATHSLWLLSASRAWKVTGWVPSGKQAGGESACVVGAASQMSVAVAAPRNARIIGSEDRAPPSGPQ